MLPAVNHLASMLNNPTQKALQLSSRIIAYAAAHPNHKVILHGCDMVLYLQSDASYLTRPNARSVAGGLAYLGNKNPDSHIPNPLLSYFSTIIDTVCSSVAEAEYVALFLTAKTGSWLRLVLDTLGYPQTNPTPILCDNEVAIGIANLSIKPKHSKAIDMRFHWIRDQIKLNHFSVHWIPGTLNYADFFTKALPRKQFNELKRAFVHLPASPENPSLNKVSQLNHIYRYNQL